MSHIEFPPAFVDFASFKPLPTTEANLPREQHSRVANILFDHVKDRVEPFMGEWRNVRIHDKYGFGIRPVRQAKSEIIIVNGVPFTFTITEHGSELGSELPMAHVYTGESKGIVYTPQFSVGMFGTHVNRKELRTREQFKSFERIVDYIADHLIQP